MLAVLALVLPVLAQDSRSPTAEEESSFRWYLPVLTSDEYKAFWSSDNPSVLNTVMLGTGFDDGNVAGSLFAELLQDNLGPVRVSLGTTFAERFVDNTATKEETTETAEETTEETTEESTEDTVDTMNDDFQKFLNGGGNAVLSTSLPLLFFDIGKPDDYSYISLLLLPRLGFDVPQIGDEATVQDLQDVPLNYDLGADATVALETGQQVFTFLLYSRMAWVGGTNAFYDNISHERSPFLLAEVSGGIRLRRLVQFTIGGYPLCPSDLKDGLPFVFRAQFYPNG